VGFTTLDEELLTDVANHANDIQQLSRGGFKVVFYDTLEEFYLAEALEYVHPGNRQRPIIRWYLRTDRSDRTTASGGPYCE